MLPSAWGTYHPFSPFSRTSTALAESIPSSVIYGLRLDHSGPYQPGHRRPAPRTVSWLLQSQLQLITVGGVGVLYMEGGSHRPIKTQTYQSLPLEIGHWIGHSDHSLPSIRWWMRPHVFRQSGLSRMSILNLIWLNWFLSGLLALLSVSRFW